MDLQYADEIDLLDSLAEFHPEWIDALPAEAVAALDAYYGFRSQPADLASWRAAHVDQDPYLQQRAQAILHGFSGLSAD